MPVKVGLRHIEIWNSSMENAVRRYEEEPIVKDQIVFYGPSNFTRWGEKFGMRPLRSEIVGKSGAPCAINRGFGSSCAEHHLYYYPRLIRPLEPRVLVYVPSYGNGKAFGYSLEESWELAQRVLAYTMVDFPETRIYLGSVYQRKVPTAENIADAAWFDAQLKAFAEEHENVIYFDMLSYEPLKNPDMFVEDGVHLNQDGYDLYAEFFREVLRDELENY
ncbi:MAG: hypothetical protein J6B77_09460 [Clostridia bacterium]|nr:hypothetical protein [Clostridia bacterium]